MKWEVLNKENAANTDEIVSILLKNRNIKNSRKFFEPTDPNKIGLKELGVRNESLKKAIDRIKKAKKDKEGVFVYGDYDADGITATAIMWEALHDYGLDVLPHIPDRFEEGYGINSTSVENLKLKIKNLKLIVTVDNGIVGYDGIKKAKELGIDVIVVDHHTKGIKTLKAYCIIHSTQVCGSALSWFFARELLKKVGPMTRSDLVNSSLELAAIGTIADQMPLTGINRSIVKYGLAGLNKTKRPGLRAIVDSSKIDQVGTYEINYIIAPRINAMGRMAQGIDSLRLLCTTKLSKAKELSQLLDKTNSERQKTVEEVVILARKNVTDQKVIVIAGENYHEGVIGLAAGRLVEEFYRPAIVISVKGDVSKASARSISGFNIIEAIRSINLHSEGGGHPMAAGFSIETNKIEKFTKEINKIANRLLTTDLLEKKLKIDCELNFDQLNYGLLGKLIQFDPTGLENPGATFMSKNVEVISAKPVGREARHLKLELKQGEQVFDSIFFGGGEMYSSLSPEAKIDIAYSLEDNSWNGYKKLQLKIKDLKIN
jgi:single-stranded-DNA-specific exonuclease